MFFRIIFHDEEHETQILCSGKCPIPLCSLARSAIHVHFSPFGDSAAYKMAADKALLANRVTASSHI